jgi:hypothetical protein
LGFRIKYLKVWIKKYEKKEKGLEKEKRRRDKNGCKVE